VVTILRRMLFTMQPAVHRRHDGVRPPRAGAGTLGFYDAGARRYELTAGLILFLVGITTPAMDAALAQSPSDGVSYETACAACHASDGRGRSPSEVGFDQPLPDFTDCDFAVREPNGDWSAIVHGGGPARGFKRLMPAFEEALSDAEIDAIIEHVRSFCMDSRWPRGELNVPRALFTEKAFPEDEAVITSTLVNEGLDSLTHEFVWEQRFGALNQIEISVPLTRADLGEPAGWKSGTGDLAVGVKHTMTHSLDKGSILAIGGELVLPTGDEAKGFGRGTTVFEASVMYDRLLPRDSFVQVQGIAEFPNASELENEIALRAAVGRTWTSGGRFGRAWTPMLEVLGTRELEGGADTAWDAVPQFQVTLNTRQHVMASAGLRVPITNRDTRVTELVFYLLWDWYDGGVLEGWGLPEP
jgi:mono/diheme cytochrome c family protein